MMIKIKRDKMSHREREKLIRLARDDNLSELEKQLKFNEILLNEQDIGGKTILHWLLLNEQESGATKESPQRSNLILQCVLLGMDLDIRDMGDESVLDLVVANACRIKGLENVKHLLIYNRVTLYTLEQAYKLCLHLLLKKRQTEMYYSQLERIKKLLEFRARTVHHLPKLPDDEIPPLIIPAPYLPKEKESQPISVKKSKAAKTIMKIIKSVKKKKKEGLPPPDDVQDAEGRTILHILLMEQRKLETKEYNRMIEKIVRSGVDLNITDNEGNSALDVAVYNATRFGGLNNLNILLNADRMSLKTLRKASQLCSHFLERLGKRLKTCKAFMDKYPPIKLEEQEEARMCILHLQLENAMELLQEAEKRAQR